MKRLLLSAAFATFTAATLVFTAPVFATDMVDMTDPERDVFRAEVRAYLLENPEVLMEAIAVLEERQAAEAVGNDAALLLQNADAIYADGVSYVGGNPDGDITIIEFADYRCGYCKKAHPEIAKLLASDGNIRLIYKEFPILGADSLTTSNFAVATLLLAGPKAYDGIKDALMDLRGTPSPDVLTNLAVEHGLDAQAVLAKMDSDEVAQVIQANHALGQALQISGTPTFIMGDQMVRGYLPLANMREIVKDIRSE